MNFLYLKNPIRIRYKWATKLSIILFYVSFFMYVISSMLRDTTLKYTNVELYDFLLHFYWIPVMIAIANVLIFTDYTIGQLLIYAAFAVVFWVSYDRYRNYRLYHSFVILLSARYVEWKPFIKRTFLLYGGLILSIYFAYCFDFLYGLDIYLRGDVVRWTLGFVHPNLAGGYMMVFALLWGTARYETFNGFDAVGILLLAVLAWYGPASRTSSFIMGIMLIVIVCSKVCGKWLLKNPITRFGMINIFPICFLFIFSCSYFYDKKKPFWVKLDTLLSGRVKYGNKFLVKYEHTWFGQKIKQVNNRTALLTGKKPMYLDSSYMRLYVGVGIVGCLITLWILTRIMRYAVENAKWDIIAGAVAMAVYGISELYITYLHWNFYLILFASLPVIRVSNLRLKEKGWLKRLVLGG